MPRDDQYRNCPAGISLCLAGSETKTRQDRTGQRQTASSVLSVRPPSHAAGAIYYARRACVGSAWRRWRRLLRRAGDDDFDAPHAHLRTHRMRMGFREFSGLLLKSESQGTAGRRKLHGRSGGWAGGGHAPNGVRPGGLEGRGPLRASYRRGNGTPRGHHCGREVTLISASCIGCCVAMR